MLLLPFMHANVDESASDGRMELVQVRERTRPTGRSEPQHDSTWPRDRVSVTWSHCPPVDSFRREAEQATPQDFAVAMPPDWVDEPG